MELAEKYSRSKDCCYRVLDQSFDLLSGTDEQGTFEDMVGQAPVGMA